MNKKIDGEEAGFEREESDRIKWSKPACRCGPFIPPRGPSSLRDHFGERLSTFSEIAFMSSSIRKGELVVEKRPLEILFCWYVAVWPLFLDENASGRLSYMFLKANCETFAVWHPVIFVLRVMIWDLERPQEMTRGKCETAITWVPSAILPLRSRDRKFLNSQNNYKIRVVRP